MRSIFSGVGAPGTGSRSSSLSIQLVPLDVAVSLPPASEMRERLSPLKFPASCALIGMYGR